MVLGPQQPPLGGQAGLCLSPLTGGALPRLHYRQTHCRGGERWKSGPGAYSWRPQFVWAYLVAVASSAMKHPSLGFRDLHSNSASDSISLETFVESLPLPVSRVHYLEQGVSLFQVFIFYGLKLYPFPLPPQPGLPLPLLPGEFWLSVEKESPRKT